MSKPSQDAGRRASSPPPSGGRRTRITAIDERPPEPMDANHRAAVAAAREQIRRGEVATDEEVGAAFRLFGP